MAFLTSHPRYLPFIEWSDRSWTHNVFRAYEKIFWRREGIRAESVTGIDENGDFFHREFTIEAKLARAETVIREWIAEKRRVLSSVRVAVLQPVPQYGVVRAFPYMLAIAFDTYTVSAAQTSSPKTFAHTCTGSNGWLNSFEWVPDSATHVTSGNTYAGAAMTLGSGIGTQNPSLGYYGVVIYYKSSPSTGSNNVVQSWTGGGNGFGYAASYSGVTNTGIGGTSSVNDSSGTTFNSTLTATGNNVGWVTWAGSGDGSFPTGVTVGTMRSTTGAQWCLADSNATVANGSYAFGYTNSSGANGSINGMEFGIAAAAGPTTVKTFDGVTQSTGIKTYLGIALASTKSVMGLT